MGEPPLCMSCSALFAVKRAIEEARKDMGNEDFFPLCKFVRTAILEELSLCTFLEAPSLAKLL